MATDYAAKVAALEDAAASGELRVESDGEMIIYRSMADLMKALEYFRAQADAQPSTATAPPNVTVAAFSRD